jgi:hypothetical protein
MCGLLDNDVNNSDCTLSVDGMINELKMTWKEAVVT